MDDEAAAAYLKYGDELVRFASAIGGMAACEDIVATVMARVLIDGDQWRTITNLRGFLVRSVINETRSRYRKEQRRFKRELRHITEARADQESPSYVRVEVLEAVSHLSVRQRAVVYLTYWLDLPTGEIAKELDVSVRTVERDLTNARRALEVLLK